LPAAAVAGGAVDGAAAGGVDGAAAGALAESAGGVVAAGGALTADAPVSAAAGGWRRRAGCRRNGRRQRANVAVDLDAFDARHRDARDRGLGVRRAEHDLVALLAHREIGRRLRHQADRRQDRSLGSAAREGEAAEGEREQGCDRQGARAKGRDGRR
jgi:hypothetical protein